MKTMKKILALVVAMMVVVAMSSVAMAQTVGTAAAGTGSITISNAAKGEEYAVVKLFDASVTGTTGGSVRYTGDIPSSLADYFVKDSAGNISATAAAKEGDKLSTAAIAALKSWAEAQGATPVVSDGSELVFQGLAYGYYVVTTSQGDNAISVDTTNPNVTIIDKNTTPPVNDLTKKVDDVDEVVSIGDVITYTVSFKTANYDGEDQITKYVITDTLPEFLTVAADAVQSIIVDDDADTSTTNDQHDVTAQFTNKTITLNWTSGTTSLYKNGALITIVYKATVNDKIAAGNVAINKNQVTVDPYAGDKKITVEDNTAEETIQTYAAAVQKVDENGNKLPGATFQVPGLTVTGSAGNYTVVSYDPTSETAGTTMECDGEGFLVIKGISNEATITIYEVDAPDGYNKLTDGVTLPVVKTSETTTTTTSSTTTTIYYDADGNVVESEVEGGSSTSTTVNTVATNADLVAGALTVTNNKGAELPSTGGMGTTILYTVGGILVIGAAILLVVRRRVGAGK